jgi:hypothetical protein
METPNVNYVIRFTQEYDPTWPSYLVFYGAHPFYPAAAQTVDRAEEHRVA